jgi:hypothetical protein
MTAKTKSVTVSEAARIEGKSRQAIQKRLRHGTTTKNKDGKIPVDQLRLDEPGPTSSAELTAIRTKHEKLKALITQIELDALRGKTCRTDDVDASAFAAARQARDRFHDIERMLPKLNALVADPVAQRTLFRREIDAVLEALANDLAGLVKR